MISSAMLMNIIFHAYHNLIRSYPPELDVNLKRATTFDNCCAISIKDAADAETCSTCADTSSVEADTSSTEALFSSLTLAMFSMD
jgi:hypothetical protein